MIILDFSKAFDTVPHGKLLDKLTHYGIEGSLHDWLRCFLTERTMKAVVDGEESEEVYIESGVPQGTVLGPLLFLCHINDLPATVKSQVRLFADDCLLYRTIRSFKDHLQLQADLESLQKWAEDWGMRFNATKCYKLSFKNKSSYMYQLCGTILKQVKNNPYLGVIISENLEWEEHILKITKKASSVLGVLRRNLRTCPAPIKRTAYCTLVRPLLEYSASVWDPHLQKDIVQLERIQSRAVRYITGDYKTHTPGFITNKLQELNLPSLEERQKNTRLVMLYKIRKNLLPSLTPDKFLTPVREGRRSIRQPRRYEGHVTAEPNKRSISMNSQCYVVPPSKTPQHMGSFFVKTPLEWNHLVESTVTAGTVEEFAHLLTSRSH